MSRTVEAGSSGLDRGSGDAHQLLVRSRRRKYYAFAVLFVAAALVSIMFHVPLYARFELQSSGNGARLLRIFTSIRMTLSRPRCGLGSFVIETSSRQSEGRRADVSPGRRHCRRGFTYATTQIGCSPAALAAAA